MAIGEEFVIGKIIDSLNKWFNQRKEKKELMHEILMSLKINLNNIPLHMDLSKRHGFIKYSTLQCYLPQDIENINILIMKYQNSLTNDFYNELEEFLRYLVKYNEKINSLHIGIGDELKQYEDTITKTINDLINRLNELIKSVE